MNKLKCIQMINSENHQTNYSKDLLVITSDYEAFVKEKASNFYSKRFLDIIFSLIILIIFFPIMILISLLIKISSNGEIIYKQERITLNEKKFQMYKFRTMYKDAELLSGPIFADDNDKRCTKIGLILRKTSLDELPQFINVLKGEMSIVGPRPERPFYVEKFKNEFKDYSKRHIVKSGITGLAQVNGLRGKTSIEKRLSYDLEYISNITLRLDIKIIFLTLKTIITDIYSLFIKN
ncbi:MAG: exopolysaccharide biosynthesis polyprenyl glycosylphosphotransferase [Candidatus Sericytochromatia bacterium]